MKSQKPKFKVHDVIVYLDTDRWHRRYLQGIKIHKAIMPYQTTRIVKVDFDEKYKNYIYTTEYERIEKDGSFSCDINHIMESEIVRKLN